MKKKLSVSLLIGIIVFYSCSKQQLPRPAISFTDTSAALLHAEKNVLIKKDIARDNPNMTYDIFGYQMQLEFYNYLTENKDTIEYLFTENHLFNVTVKIPGITIEELNKRVEDEFEGARNSDGIYETKDYCIIIGQNGNNNGCYITYFPPR